MSSCGSNGPVESKVMSAGTSDTTWSSWYVEFKPGTSQSLRDLSLDNIEKKLIDSINFLKKELKKDFNIIVSRNYSPSSDPINYQIKIGMFGGELFSLQDHPLAVASNLVITGKSPGLHIRSNTVDYSKVFDTIIIKKVAESNPPKVMALSLQAAPSDTIIIKNSYVAPSDTIIIKLCGTSPCHPS
ncbi:MAG TPA: hypothetical protein VMI12_07440 [Puia sp.]|nr:hypothetical protein [Puia sp.]